MTPSRAEEEARTGMGITNFSFLHKIFGDDLQLECYACGKKFKNEEEFMEHEHSDKEASDGK